MVKKAKIILCLTLFQLMMMLPNQEFLNQGRLPLFYHPDSRCAEFVVCQLVFLNMLNVYEQLDGI